MTEPLLDVARLAEAYPIPSQVPDQRPWTRANFATTPNGVIKIAGKSGGVSGPPDREVFNFLRANCDAILVGASTARVEAYSMPKPSSTRATAPLLIIVTNSFDISDNSSFLDEATSPLIVTNSNTAEAKRSKIARLSPRATVVAFGKDSVDFPGLFAHLRSEGVRTLLFEGGPATFSQLLRQGLIDELCLTISPRIGNGTPTGFANIADASPIEMTLSSHFEIQSYLFCRYSLTSSLPLRKGIPE
ncbi:MAG: dihydrofolate reductase family protein [Actinomycetota bacterium]|jgi:riboflavin biosynthesis pyrimidine reductase|nr:dihydrofolate reductase family protein [Actinomycetota bacterium]